MTGAELTQGARFEKGLALRCYPRGDRVVPINGKTEVMTAHLSAPLAYIHITIDPVIVQFGGFAIHWYGLIMAVAAIVGTFVFAGQLEKRGIERSHAWNMLLVAVPLAIIGARLFHVLDNFSFYWHNPGEIVTKQLVGFAIYGVVTGGVAAVIIYCRWQRLPTWRALDGLALAIPIGQLIGRCANIINGDTWGPATKLPFGLLYTNPHAFLPANLLGVPTQPTPIYEQLWLIVVIIAVCASSRASKPTAWPSCSTLASTPSGASSSATCASTTSSSWGCARRS